ncbi:MAG: hypothetical protein U0X39_02665 [Bacteroidales bacterium]
MKKPLLIVIIVVVVILIFPAIKFLGWSFREKKPLDIIILDKTVPSLDRLNHRSFTWILTNERFVKNNKSSYSYKKDYYGFFPTRPLRTKLWDANNLRLPDIMDVVQKNDVLYYTDTYGVYMNDWYRSYTKSRRSRKLYGGLNNTDYLYLVEMQRNNKLCILEYNAFDYPTAPLEKYKTNERLGISFNGWTGKYFGSLDTAAKGNEDFPNWITAMYRKEYRQPWNFSKAGIVFLKENKILVLEEGTHLKSALPAIVADSSLVSKYGVAARINFQGWFDVIDPLGSKVLANFNIETTSVGDTLLTENMLSNVFPAIITDTANQRTYYFSGDFASNNVPFIMARLGKPGILKSLLYSNKPDDKRNFFWEFYKPLMTGILTDYYEQIKKK